MYNIFIKQKGGMKVKTYKIYFIRHGLTEGNLKGQYIGQTDIPVIPEGLQMLKKAGLLCKIAEKYSHVHHGIKTVFSSSRSKIVSESSKYIGVLSLLGLNSFM